jgi:hypothetical protein
MTFMVIISLIKANIKNFKPLRDLRKLSLNYLIANALERNGQSKLNFLNG